jgi:hypothetical protein
VSGWINYLGKVISHKMSENKMGYRVSKSKFKLELKRKFKLNFVKEQRVDGSWCSNNLLYLRCTLMGFERNYQIKIPSKQINIYRSYSSLINL